MHSILLLLLKTTTKKGGPAPPLQGPSSREEMIREALEGKGEIPLIVIVSVSICGTVLLLLNIVLISCFVHKRRQQQQQLDRKRDPNRDPAAPGSKQTPPSEGRQTFKHFMQGTYFFKSSIYSFINVPSYVYDAHLHME